VTLPVVVVAWGLYLLFSDIGTVVAALVAVAAPVCGGAVAGYRQGSAGLRVGGFSGAFLVVLSLPVQYLVASAAALSVSMGHTASPPAAAVMGGVFVSSLLLAVAYFVGLGALGGHLGEELATGDSS